MLIITVITLLASLGLVFVAYTAFQKKMSGGSGAAKELALAEITTLDAQLAQLLQSKDSFIGKNQFGSLEKRVADAKSGLEVEKQTLKGIEEKLDTAQKLVEGKESAQQEIKAAKEEDIQKVQELLAGFEDFSREAVELEQKLALSLKSLDQIIGEVELTANQKAMLAQLSEAVTTGGSRLRDLLIEYQTVHERLQMLQQQHVDLEEEYTRLVEQQLGE